MTARASGRAAILISHPVEKVFSFVCNPENDPLWMPKLGPGKQVTCGPIGAGTAFRQSVLVMGRPVEFEWELIEYVPNSRAVARSLTGPIAFEGGYDFEDKEAATLVTKFGSVFLTGFLLAIPEYIGSALLSNEFDRSLHRLKSILDEIL